MVFFPHSKGFFFSYTLCSSRALDQFFTLLSGVAEAGVSAPPGNKQNRRRLRLQQRARRHNRTTRRHQTIPPPITTNSSSTLPARLHPSTPIPHTPTQTIKQHPSRTRRKNRARKPGAVPVGHGGRTQQEPARGVAGERPQRAQNEKAHRQGARASASGLRTARKHARTARGGGPGESTRVRRTAARREGARARVTGRRAAREHACGPVRRGRGGLAAAQAERAMECPRRPPPKLSFSRELGRSRQF